MALASPADDLAACRALLRTGSRSFHTASRVLPRRVADPATALYAFCRLADDAVDVGDGKLPALARLRERLDRAYAGRPLPIPADRAFAHVIAEHRLPRALPEALLEGLQWDAEGRDYDTLGALEDYAARVAGAVGAMMAVLMGARDPVAVARACDLGVAMQLSNIARDVGEDARMGRIYLPLAWLREAGIDPAAFLAAPRFTPALGRVVQRLLAHAETLYARAEAGVAALPRDCRPGIGAARLIYAEIGRQVAACDGDSVSSRAVVSDRRKLALLARGLGAITWRAAANPPPPLAATRYLVEAVQAELVPARPRGLGESTAWLCDLTLRLARRDAALEYPRMVRGVPG